MYSPAKFVELILKAVEKKDGSEICRFFYFQNGMLIPGSNEQKLLPIIFAYKNINVSQLVEALEEKVEYHCFPTRNGLVFHLLRKNKLECEECSQHHRVPEKAPRKQRG